MPANSCQQTWSDVSISLVDEGKSSCFGRETSGSEAAKSSTVCSLDISELGEQNINFYSSVLDENSRVLEGFCAGKQGAKNELNASWS